jgi:hypothetical protein
VFDGRYAYFIPFTFYGGSGLVIARVDVQGDFTAPSSWSTYRLPRAGYASGAFDGEFVYLVPDGRQGNRTALRFDSKAPPSMPMSYTGSFF